MPGLMEAQSFDRRFSIQAAAGPTVVDAGHHVSAAIGFAPASRVTFLLDVQRTQISSRVTQSDNSVSKFRGGTLTAVSGEVLDAAKARAIYESIVRQQRDPALVEWMGRGLLRCQNRRPAGRPVRSRSRNCTWHDTHPRCTSPSRSITGPGWP